MACTGHSVEAVVQAEMKVAATVAAVAMAAMVAMEELVANTFQ